MEQFDFSNLHEKEKPSDIEQYFTKAQLENLSDYEKVRYRNMKKNYEMMVKMGLPALMPDFMQKRQKNKKMEEVSVPSDSDEEWKPFKPRAPKPKRGSLGKKQGLERVAKKNISYSDSDEDWEPNKERNKRRKVVKKDHNENGNEVVQSSTPEAQGEGDSKTNVQQKHRYPLRDVPTVTYMYLEVPDDDEFIYCEDCETEYEGDCPVHPSTRILDSKVSSNGENRAIETLPEGMSVRESSIPDAGLGVWTNRDIPCRSVFGPYEGEITKDAEKAHSTGYAWQYFRGYHLLLTGVSRRKCCILCRQLKKKYREIPQNPLARHRIVKITSRKVNYSFHLPIEKLGLEKFLPELKNSQK